MFFFSSRRRHTRFKCDWSSDVCSSDLKHVVVVTKNLLTDDDVLQRHSIRISQHVVKHHERSRPSKTRFAMEMRPGIFRKRANSENKAVHFLIERTRMTGNDEAYIARTTSTHDVGLRTR